jgi:hypothetical protein
MKGTFIYEPEVAAGMVKTHPEECWLSLSDTCKFIADFGLTPDDLKGALREGLLQASGVPTATGGYKEVKVRADGLIAWLDRPGVIDAGRAAIVPRNISNSVTRGKANG